MKTIKIFGYSFVITRRTSLEIYTVLYLSVVMTVGIFITRYFYVEVLRWDWGFISLSSTLLLLSLGVHLYLDELKLIEDDSVDEDQEILDSNAKNAKNAKGASQSELRSLQRLEIMQNDSYLFT